jgi:hypothetical protein
MVARDFEKKYLADSCIAQPDLANGTRFQVLMKDRYTLTLRVNNSAVLFTVIHSRVQYSLIDVFGILLGISTHAESR